MNDYERNADVSKTLTDKWRKGELPYAEYYIKLAGGEYTSDVWDIDGWQSFNKKGDVVVEVLAEVPSYEELQNMNEAVNECMAANIKLVEQNRKLKELLKDCREILYVEEMVAGNPRYIDGLRILIKRINQVLGEE